MSGPRRLDFIPAGNGSGSRPRVHEHRDEQDKDAG